MNSFLRNVKSINIPTLKYFSQKATPSLSTIENRKSKSDKDTWQYWPIRSRSLPPNLSPFKAHLEQFCSKSFNDKSITKTQQKFQKLLNHPTFKTANRKNFGQKIRKPQEKPKSKQNIRDAICRVPCIKPENDAPNKKSLLSLAARNLHTSSSSPILQKASSFGTFKELYKKSPIKALINLNDEAKRNSNSTNFIGRRPAKDKVKFHYLAENTECKQCISKNKKRIAEFYIKNEDKINFSQKKRHFSSYVRDPMQTNPNIPREVVVVKDQNLNSPNLDKALTLFSLIKLQSTKNPAKFVPTNFYKFEAKKKCDSYEFSPEESSPLFDPYPLEMFREDSIHDIIPAESSAKRIESCPDLNENHLEFVANQYLTTIKPREKDMFKKLYEITPCGVNLNDNDPSNVATNGYQKKFKKLRMKVYKNIMLDSDKRMSRKQDKYKIDNRKDKSKNNEPPVQGTSVISENTEDDLKYSGLSLAKRKIVDEDSGGRKHYKLPKTKRDSYNKKEKGASKIDADYIKMKPIDEIIDAKIQPISADANEKIVRGFKNIEVRTLKEAPSVRYSWQDRHENNKNINWLDHVVENRQKVFEKIRLMDIFKTRTEKYRDFIAAKQNQEAKVQELSVISQNQKESGPFFIHPKDSLNEKICQGIINTVPKVELGEQTKQIIASTIKQMIEPIIEKEFLKYEEVKGALERMEKRLNFTLNNFKPMQSKFVDSRKRDPKYIKYPWQKIRIGEQTKSPGMVDPLEKVLEKRDPVRRVVITTPAWRRTELQDDPKQHSIFFSSKNTCDDDSEEILKKSKKVDCFAELSQKKRQLEAKTDCESSQKVDLCKPKGELQGGTVNCQKSCKIDNEDPCVPKSAPCAKSNDIPMNVLNCVKCPQTPKLKVVWPPCSKSGDTKPVSGCDEKKCPEVNPVQCIQTPCQKCKPSIENFNACSNKVACAEASAEKPKRHGIEGMKEIIKPDLTKNEPCPCCKEPVAETFIRLPKTTPKEANAIPKEHQEDCEVKNRYCDSKIFEKEMEQIKKLEKMQEEKLKRQEATACNRAVVFKEETKKNWQAVQIDTNKMNDKQTIKQKPKKCNSDSGQKQNPSSEPPKSCKSATSANNQSQMLAAPAQDQTLVESCTNKISDLCMMIVRKNKSGKKAAPIVVTLARSQPAIGKFGGSSGMSVTGSRDGDDGNRKKPDSDILDFSNLNLFKKTGSNKEKSIFDWALGSKSRIREEKPENFLNMKDNRSQIEPSVDLNKIANRVLCKSNKNHCDGEKKKSQIEKPELTSKKDSDQVSKKLKDCLKRLRENDNIREGKNNNKDHCSSAKQKKDPCSDKGSSQDPKVKKLNDCVKKNMSKSVIVEEKSNDHCKKSKEDPCKKKEDDPCKKPQEDPCKKKDDDPCKKQKQDPCKKKESDPCKKPKEDPCKKKDDDPCKKPKEDLCKKKDDDPCKKQKQDLCKKKESDPCKKPKEDPCKKKDDDPCKKPKEDPCKKKDDDPCKKPKEDPCKKKEVDPCKKPKEDPCKKKSKPISCKAKTDICKEKKSDICEQKSVSEHKSEPCIPCKYEDYTKKSTKSKSMAGTKSEPCIPCKYEDYSKKSKADPCKKDSNKAKTLADCIDKKQSKDATCYQPKSLKAKSDDTCKSEKKKDPCGSAQDPKIKEMNDCVKKRSKDSMIVVDHNKDEASKKSKEDPCKKKDDPCKPKKEDPCKKKDDPCKSKKEDPCKKKDDPCKPKKEDPCKKKDDPCKPKKEDPSKKKDDPCKPKKDDPCKKKDDPCKPKKVDPCKKKDDPCKPKKDDPCKKKDDPCKKKDDPCKTKKEDPCKKKDDPCKTKKEDPCKMSGQTAQFKQKKDEFCKEKVDDPCKPKKEDPCKKKDDPCKPKKEDPCKKKEDPCKPKKEDPCKKKDDPCKPKKEDPCKKKDDPCKAKKEDPCKKKDDPCKPKKEDPCKKKDDSCKPKKEDTCKKKEEDPCKKKKDPCKSDKQQDPCKTKQDDPCKKATGKFADCKAILSGRLLKVHRCDGAMNKPIKKEKATKQHFKEKYPWILTKKSKECLLTTASKCKLKKSNHKMDLCGSKAKSDPCLQYRKSKEDEPCAAKNKLLKKFEMEMNKKPGSKEDPCEKMASVSAKAVPVMLTNQINYYRWASYNQLGTALGIICNKTFIKVGDFSSAEIKKGFHTSSRVKKSKSASLNGKKSQCEASGSKSTHNCGYDDAKNSDTICDQKVQSNEKSTCENLFPKRSKVDSTLGIIEFCKQKLMQLKKLEVESMREDVNEILYQEKATIKGNSENPKHQTQIDCESVEQSEPSQTSATKDVLECVQSCKASTSNEMSRSVQQPSNCCSEISEANLALGNLKMCVKKGHELTDCDLEATKAPKYHQELPKWCRHKEIKSENQQSYSDLTNCSKNNMDLEVTQKAQSDSMWRLIHCIKKWSKKNNDSEIGQTLINKHESKQSAIKNENSNFLDCQKNAKVSSKKTKNPEDSCKKPTGDFCKTKKESKEDSCGSSGPSQDPKIRKLNECIKKRSKQTIMGDHSENPKEDPCKKSDQCAQLMETNGEFSKGLGKTKQEGPCEETKQSSQIMKEKDDFCKEKKVDSYKPKKESPCPRSKNRSKQTIIRAVCENPKVGPCEKSEAQVIEKPGEFCKRLCKPKQEDSKKVDTCKPKKEDPCKKKDDPCKPKTKDPCKEKDDPCKPKKEDPCKKKDDPCKTKKEDPCKKKDDPCKPKKEDPCKKKDDPCKPKKEDPCKKKDDACEPKNEDPCQKKDDPCKPKKGDPCKKKDDPCKPKKESQCTKSEQSPRIMTQKQDPCEPKKEDSSGKSKQSVQLMKKNDDLICQNENSKPQVNLIETLNKEISEKMEKRAAEYCQPCTKKTETKKTRVVSLKGIKTKNKKKPKNNQQKKKELLKNKCLQKYEGSQEEPSEIKGNKPSVCKERETFLSNVQYLECMKNEKSISKLLCNKISKNEDSTREQSPLLICKATCKAHSELLQNKTDIKAGEKSCLSSNEGQSPLISCRYPIESSRSGNLPQKSTSPKTSGKSSSKSANPDAHVCSKRAKPGRLTSISEAQGLDHYQETTAKEKLIWATKENLKLHLKRCRELAGSLEKDYLRLKCDLASTDLSRCKEVTQSSASNKKDCQKSTDKYPEEFLKVKCAPASSDRSQCKKVTQKSTAGNQHECQKSSTAGQKSLEEFLKVKCAAASSDISRCKEVAKKSNGDDKQDCRKSSAAGQKSLEEFLKVKCAPASSNMSRHREVAHKSNAASKSPEDFLKMILSQCEEPTDLPQCKKQAQKSTAVNQCLKSTSIEPPKEYSRLKHSGSTSTLSQLRDVARKANVGKDQCFQEASTDHLELKCDPLPECKEVTRKAIAEQGRSSVAKESAKFRKEYLQLQCIREDQIKPVVERKKSICPVSGPLPDAKTPEDYLKLKCNPNEDPGSSYKHYLKPRCPSKIPLRIIEKCPTLRSKSTCETSPQTMCSREVKQCASINFGNEKCLMVDKKDNGSLQFFKTANHAGTSREGDCSKVALEDSNPYANTDLLCDPQTICNSAEVPIVLAKEYLCPQLLQEDNDNEKEFCVDPETKPKHYPLQKGIKNLTVGYDDMADVRDMGLLRESMLMTRRKLNPVTTTATEEEVEEILLRSNTFVAKVQKLGLGEKLVCTCDKNGKLVDEYEDKDFYQDGVERIVKCAVVNEKLNRTKLVCVEILSDEELDNLEKEQLRRKQEGKQVRIPLVKVISNKLFCKGNCTGRGFKCEMMTVEEIRVPRRKSNKIKKPIRKVLSYIELMEKCRERGHME